MKQVVRELGSGRLRVADVPAPQLLPGGILVRNHFSVLSPGTERMKVEQARKSLLGKALERPEDVKKVLETASREGVGAAYRKVRGRLSELTTLGYSCAGTVEAVGKGVTRFRKGDRVACAGEGYASHSERIWVPENLAVTVPDPVPLDRAAFATLGAIALHGIRQADLRLGESALVVGLGLVGQLTVRLLRAAGIRVVGVDLDEGRVAVARSTGARALLRSDPVEERVRELTGGLGADAVLLTATTKSTDPMELAVEAARDRGRIVVVGQVPLEASRVRFQAKELELRTSRSYGPGRHDPSYEEEGVDYPPAYVRWTEGRNLEAFLAFLEDDSVRVDDLITHRFPIARAEEAYARITDGDGGDVLAVVLEYPARTEPEPGRIRVATEVPPALKTSSAPGQGSLRLGAVGAGRFAVSTLFPHLAGLPVTLRGVASAGGTSALAAAERFRFGYMAAEPDELFRDPEVDAVVIATRHGSHAELAAGALRAGKHVWVEKPLALNEEELDDVLEAASESGTVLMVGFNRRFAPATELLAGAFRDVPGGRVVQIRVNAGAVPRDSWVHDPVQGGGRLVGEGCHFVDLALHLLGSAPRDVHAAALGGEDPDADLQDNVQVTLTTEDGSLASILYTSRGSARFEKERVELFGGGAVGVIEDFRRARVHGGAGGRWRGRQDKGQGKGLEAFVRAAREGGEAPIPLGELEASSRAVLRARRSLEEGGVVPAVSGSASAGAEPSRPIQPPSPVPGRTPPGPPPPGRSGPGPPS